MNKKTLEEYDACKKELDDIRKRIANLNAQIKILEHEKVADTVKGSRQDGTYGIIKISGIPVSEYRMTKKHLAQRMEQYNLLEKRLSEMITDVERFINEEVTDPEIRLTLRLKYVDGNTWEQIGRKIGRSADSCRIMVNRYLK